MTPIVRVDIGFGNRMELWRRYVQRVGAPRVIACRIEVGPGSPGSSVWECKSHEIGFGKRVHLLDGRLDDRCPFSRLEEWRARRWEATA